MVSPTPDITDIATRRQALNRFSCLRVAPTLSAEEQSDIRETLLLFNQLSEYQTLGICADDLPTAKTALETYAIALGCPPITLDLGERSGAVYLKFNTLKGAWYLDDYAEISRGVLVSYHGADPEVDLLNGTYGPFPFDLFA
ncbi:MAG: DUF1824 family protein [Cyanobacteria bacterium]|nr:DUF1824 family protein [Cyanobacteriota bacterium]